MKLILRRFAESIALVLFALSWCQTTEAQQAMAALVSEMSGGATVRPTPTAARRALERFDAVPGGATVELGPRSRVVLVLVGGRRFTLGPNARATVADGGLTGTSGPVTELASLPRLPRITALSDSRPQGPGGAVRLRSLPGTTISGLRPSRTAVLTGALTLRFEPVARATRYAVEIDSVEGHRVFAAESTTTDIEVPAGVIAAGGSYSWTVRTLDRPGGEARGSAPFTVLSLEATRMRQALHQALESEDPSVAMPLTAEIDRQLGLYREALDGFRVAQARTPNDQSMRRAIRWLEALDQPEDR